MDRTSLSFRWFHICPRLLRRFLLNFQHKIHMTPSVHLEIEKLRPQLTYLNPIRRF